MPVGHSCSAAAVRFPAALDTAGTSFPGLELQRVTNGVANSHLNEAQWNLLVALESANEEGTEGEGVDAKGRGGKGKPLRHSLHRTPTPAQQARWEAVQQAKGRGYLFDPSPGSWECPGWP